MNRINWTVTVEEANYILAALGTRPFAEVVNLIQKLKSEAETQVQAMQQTVQAATTEAPAVN